MANQYTKNPVRIDTVMASGWKANQNLFSSASTAVFGRVTKVIWDAPGASASFAIVDPNDANLTLLQGSTPASFVGPTVQFDFEGMNACWRDFKVSTLSAGTLFIWYRP